MNWQIPTLTADLPGVGGVIRAEIEDFVVEEVPAYAPCGEGEHTFFGVEKRDLSTPMLIKQVARALGVDAREVSSAGLKDARAVARQTLCVHAVPPETVLALELENARVLWAERHTNKLRSGHLKGNRFTLRLRDVCAEAEARAAAILAELDARGVPNGYGPQRFGQQGNNHEIGLAILRNDREAMKAYNVHHLPWQMRGFMVSALQSALFNQVVAARMAQGTMDDVLPGDVAKKTETGGLFTVVDVDAERARVKAWEISATGPMYGFKMMAAQAAAGALEAQILAESGIALEDFRRVKADGSRRPLRYRPEGLTWRMENATTLEVAFFAPKGAFATMLLRELMKNDTVTLPEEAD